jgi:hypothetical protein
MFHSIVDYTKAVEVLSVGGPDKPKILRTKDKITNPLENGYRDVLMNIEVPDTEGLVCELQLHLHEIHELKKLAHRNYKLKRAVGWDQPQTGEVAAEPLRHRQTVVTTDRRPSRPETTRTMKVRADEASQTLMTASLLDFTFEGQAGQARTVKTKTSGKPKTSGNTAKVSPEVGVEVTEAEADE